MSVGHSGNKEAKRRDHIHAYEEVCTTACPASPWAEDVATLTEYVTANDKAMSSLAAVNAKQPCGGISLNGEQPKCCEVHLLPWGHARLIRPETGGSQ